MKKIRDFKKNERYEMPLLVNECKNGVTSKGQPYLSLVLQDSSGQIDAKFWNVTEQDQSEIRSGRISVFSFDVIEYSKNLQLRIFAVAPADQKNIDFSEYVISSQFSLQERKDKLAYFVNSIKNENYRKLTEEMLNRIGEHYFTYPAASKIHHNYMGGLSEHSLSMAELAENVADHYPQLDRDLLVCGALLHDVGKTAEMSGPVSTEYTVEGKLEGHISIANGWLTAAAEKLHLEHSEEAVLLHHMILSHHGHYEFGSPVLPMTQEAEALTLIDQLDASMNTLKQALANVKPGSFTSRLYALDNRQFYKPKKEKES